MGVCIAVALCALAGGIMATTVSPPPDRATEKDRCSSAYRLSTTLEYVLSDRGADAGAGAGNREG